MSNLEVLISILEISEEKELIDQLKINYFNEHFLGTYTIDGRTFAVLDSNDYEETRKEIAKLQFNNLIKEMKSDYDYNYMASQLINLIDENEGINLILEDISNDDVESYFHGVLLMEERNYRIYEVETV